MAKARVTAQPGKKTGEHGGNRSGHRTRGADKVSRAGRQGAGKNPTRSRKAKR